MRLTCPNCSAQYEVPDEVIPEEGRDVQCSNCEKTWFQDKNPATEAKAADVEETEVSTEVAVEEPVAAEPEPEPSEPEAPETEVEDAGSVEAEEQAEEQVEPVAAKGSNVDPAVASILQEEAKREADLRTLEGENLESQPDLGLPPQSNESPEPAVPEATEITSDNEQTGPLPDIETINSTLNRDEASAATEDEEPAKHRSGGFLRGFSLIVVIGVVLYLIYGNANRISEAVPQADPVLSSYVSMVDQARIWLESQAGGSKSDN